MHPTVVHHGVIVDDHHQDPVAFKTALTHEPVGHETTHKELSHVQERESAPVHKPLHTNKSSFDFQTALTHEPIGHETTHRELSHVQERESAPVHKPLHTNEYYRYGDVPQSERLLHDADDSRFRAAAYAKNLSTGSMGFLQ